MTIVQATITAAVIGGIFGLISALVGAYFAVKFQSRRNAEQAFSDSVNEILEGMYPEPVNWPKNSWQVLQDKMPQMQCAIAKLKFHLSVAEINRIDTAWGKYKKWCNQINDAEIFAKPLYPESQPTIDYVNVFNRHVNVLLSYSKKV